LRPADPTAIRRSALSRREIEELMAAPPRPLPSIIVVGDEAVFGITPPPARRSER
jgi:hypothetical protein